MKLQSMKYLPCSCPVCSRTSVKGLLELDPGERTKGLAVHNLHVLRGELESCKEAIAEGRLWDLVEERATAHPRLREAFTELSKRSKELTAGTPALKERGLFVRSQEDLARPEVVAAASRLAGAYHRSSERALLLTGRKPGRSTEGRRGFDAYRVHPVLGPYPSELEFMYPFSQTETDASKVQVDLEGAKRRLKALGYTRVVAEGGAGRRPRRVRSRRSRRGASPSPRSSSARSR